MSKAKTNALDALRGLIAERQQYDQWITALDTKREGTPEHVFERVQADYRGRLDRVVTDIKGHAEELQLSISTLSSRLVEVAREEDSRREGLQEAELRAAVGEYQPQQWEDLRSDAEQALERIAADRTSLDGQLSELRAIQKLSEVGSVGSASAPDADKKPIEATPHVSVAAPVPSPGPPVTQPIGSAPQSAPTGTPSIERRPVDPAQAANTAQTRDQERLPLEPVAEAAAVTAGAAGRPRSAKTPPGGVSASRGRSEAAKPDQAKTLKCPECGSANYPTEWYCEKCGGELATM